MITILVPARDEEEHIEDFLRDVTAACLRLNLIYELLVVESGSSDKTASLVAAAAEKDPRIRLITVSEPGYGRAIIQGIKESSGEYVVFFNVDFWNMMFLQMTMVENLGFDIVSGSKLLPGSRDSRNVYRRTVSRIFNYVFIRLLLGFEGTDTHGLKVLKTEIVKPILLECVTNNDIFDTELMVRCQRAGLRMLELPVNVKEIRPSRFVGKRVWRIPLDILRLCAILGPAGNETRTKRVLRPGRTS